MSEPSFSGFRQRVVYQLEIAKVPLCLFVAFSALFGFLYAEPLFSGRALLLFTAVLLLACGAASLNSFQERDLDGLMRRTRNRPLVEKKLSEAAALSQSAILVLAGLILLFLTGSYRAFAVGVVAFFLYNFFYTKLKQKSLCAIIPGALCGATPPYIGWLAAGGEIWSLRAALPVVLLFIWQIPHYLLVLLNHKSDYLSSRYPNILKELSEPSLRRIFLSWISALTVAMLFFTVFPSQMNGWSRLLIAINALVMVSVFIVQLVRIKGPNYGYLFIHLGVALFFLMFIVILSAFFVEGKML